MRPAPTPATPTARPETPRGATPARTALTVRTTRRALAGGLRLFRLRESRERIARGFALGLVVNFLPSFGFGVLISGFLARSLGGNLLAGLMGGASLTFAWPLLFYWNIRVGALFVKPERVVDELADVTTETVSAMMWGQAFIVGAAVNATLAGIAVYGILMLIYAPLRPRAVRWLRRRSARPYRRSSSPAGGPPPSPAAASRPSTGNFSDDHSR
ncbi:MAG: DUF2062 domain-containing protein [Phycisphaeraceae bacterium]|nr:MAG: DUF2062 domain-containing protein [Phycisphaeraceae bacterium]